MTFPALDDFDAERLPCCWKCRFPVKSLDDLLCLNDHIDQNVDTAVLELAYKFQHHARSCSGEIVLYTDAELEAAPSEALPWYQIQLREIVLLDGRSEEVLSTLYGWLFHLWSKRWFGPAAIRGLFNAHDAALRLAGRNQQGLQAIVDELSRMAALNEALRADLALHGYSTDVADELQLFRATVAAVAERWRKLLP